MRRVTWFVTGVAAGATGANYAARKVRERASQLRPATVARSAGRRVADAVRDGRDAMRSREDELKARRDRRVRSIDDHIGPDEELLVDGRPVELGRVVVLKRR